MKSIVVLAVALFVVLVCVASASAAWEIAGVKKCTSGYELNFFDSKMKTRVVEAVVLTDGQCEKLRNYFSVNFPRELIGNQLLGCSNCDGDEEMVRMIIEKILKKEKEKT